MKEARAWSHQEDGPIINDDTINKTVVGPSGGYGSDTPLEFNGSSGIYSQYNSNLFHHHDVKLSYMWLIDTFSWVVSIQVILIIKCKLSYCVQTELLHVLGEWYVSN